ncbi:MAG: hypothetical protein JSV18_05805, partial [Candidatus Bathyarchaeota archaeon]
MNIDEIIDGVPDYEEFLTVDELNASSQALAEEYGHVEMFKAGISTEGEAIHALKIGSGSRNELLFGFPHP